MKIRKTMSDNSNCNGCKNCDHYPYFHYEKSKNGFDVEYIKFDANSAKVINHTNGNIHIYNGKKWKLTCTP